MARIPDKAEQQRRFAALDVSERRTIIRAVNRGQGVEQRKLVVPAIGVARRQQRFWRWAWLLGPVVGGSQALFPGVSIQAAALNVVVATGILLALSRFWFVRARRSERTNLEKAGVSPSSPKATTTDDGDRGSTRRGRAHLPGRGGSQAAPSGAEAPDADDHALPSAPERRPYRPRGQKRRDRD